MMAIDIMTMQMMFQVARALVPIMFGEFERVFSKVLIRHRTRPTNNPNLPGKEYHGIRKLDQLTTTIRKVEKKICST